MTLSLPDNSAPVPVDPATVSDVIAHRHRTFHVNSAAVVGAGLPDAERIRNLGEADIASISTHLAVLQTYVFPVARRRLPEGRAEVARLLVLGRRTEHALRAIQGRLHGDVFTVPHTYDELQTQLATLVTDLRVAEQALAERLDTVLTAAESDALVRRLLEKSRHAPTRPHPYTPHSWGLARIAFRMCAAVDHSLDVMDNRILPRTTPA